MGACRRPLCFSAHALNQPVLRFLREDGDPDEGHADFWFQAQVHYCQGHHGQVSRLSGLEGENDIWAHQVHLHKNKRGKIVSKRQTAAGRKAYSKIAPWTKACSQAKKSLNIKGFVLINGKTSQGKALYAKAKSLYSA